MEPIGQLVTEFSEPEAVAPSWDDVVRLLESAEMFWLSTVRRDGRPHVAPLPAMWLAGKLYFCSGAHEQKVRNLEANANCVLTTGTNSYRSGVDIVVEGTVGRAGEAHPLARLAALWKDKLDWPFEVVDGIFVDPKAAGHPAQVFAVTPSKVLVFSKAPYGQTRFVM